MAPEDNELIDLFLSRSEEALRLTGEKYGPLLFSRAERLLESRQDAEECVNDTLLALWNTIPPVLPDSLPAYASRLLRNQAMKKLRDRTRLKRAPETYTLCLEEIEPLAASCALVEDELMAGELHQAVIGYLDSLPKNDRMLFLRRFSLMDSYEALSAWSGLSEGALRTRISRILKGLRKHLEKDGLLN